MDDARINRLEAGGFEDDLRRIIDEVEAANEDRLRSTLGRKARTAVIKEMKHEILERFAKRHPGVKVRFLSEPYCDHDTVRGHRGRRR